MAKENKKPAKRGKKKGSFKTRNFLTGGFCKLNK
jgi:hypothetical protein